MTAVGAISQLPLTGQGPLQPYAYDAETARNWERLSADSFSITPGYFAAVRATLLAGRDLTDGRDRQRPARDRHRRLAGGPGLRRRRPRRRQAAPARAGRHAGELLRSGGRRRAHALSRSAARAAAADLSRRPVQDVQRGHPRRRRRQCAGRAGRAAIAEIRPGTAVQDVRLLADHRRRRARADAAWRCG